MRYLGPELRHRRPRPADDGDALTRRRAGRVVASFHAEHERLYGYDIPDEIDRVRATSRSRAVGPTDKPRCRRCSSRGRGASPTGERAGLLPRADGWVPTARSTTARDSARRRDARGPGHDRGGDGDDARAPRPDARRRPLRQPHHPDRGGARHEPSRTRRSTRSRCRSSTTTWSRRRARWASRCATPPTRRSSTRGSTSRARSSTSSGEMIAQAEFCPAHLGAISTSSSGRSTRSARRTSSPATSSSTTTPSAAAVTCPSTASSSRSSTTDELVGFVACIGHMTEVGGKVPGGFAGDATEVFQEGIRIPPVKIVDGGRDVEAIWNIILANVRTPRMSYGDMKAMIGSLHRRRAARARARRASTALPRFRAIKEAIKDYSERRMRAEIARDARRRLPLRGHVIDNDGVTDEPSRLRLTVTIDGDEMIVDYTGSDPQRRGPVNCTYGVTASATYNALLHLTDHDIPSNHGCYRPVRIIAPPGTIVNVEYPGASVGGNSEIHPHLVMAIYGALSEALPERVSAHDGGTSELLAIGGVHPDTGDVFANLTNEGCGWGGRATEGRQQRALHPERQLRPAADRDPRDALPDPPRGAGAQRGLGRRRAKPRRPRLLPPDPGRPRRSCALPASSRRRRSRPGASSAAARASAPRSWSAAPARSASQTFGEALRRRAATASSRTSTCSGATRPARHLGRRRLRRSARARPRRGSRRTSARASAARAGRARSTGSSSAPTGPRSTSRQPSGGARPGRAMAERVLVARADFRRSTPSGASSAPGAEVVDGRFAAEAELVGLCRDVDAVMTDYFWSGGRSSSRWRAAG